MATDEEVRSENVARVYETLVLEFLLESGATSKQLTERQVIQDDDTFLIPMFRRPCGDNVIVVAPAVKAIASLLRRQ